MNSKTRKLVIAAVTAALYVALTLGLAPISFFSVQFRIAELLNLMAFINPVYGIGVIIGCLISNLFSPFGMIDVVIGTLSTAMAIFAITKTKNLFIASLWPTVFSICVGAEIAYLENLPFLITSLSVMAGQFAVVTCIGYPLFRFILQNKTLSKKLKLEDI